jgi:ABC-type multidrug transport system fused ATPase/permease subunit
MNVNHLRSNIAFVEQQPTLFNSMTISDNISYGRPNSTHEKIVDAAKRANIHESIQALPNKYDTMIGTDGLLSGGQTQRIALARVLLMNSKILILDEVNAALDVENEKVRFTYIL